MKRVVRAASYGRDKQSELIDLLTESGVSADTVLNHFLDYFSADECVEALEDLCKELDLLTDEEE